MSLDALLTLQDHDGALDRLRHRNETLPERESLARVESALRALDGEIAALTARRDELAREETRLDDEARSLGEKAVAVDKRMYSGEISSPKELQAMQADIDQLKRHQQAVETSELELMEQREPLDAELRELAERRASMAAEGDQLRATLDAAERDIAAEVSVEQAARDAVARTIDESLVGEYERCRSRARGSGAARLVGHTCQGCHLTIPATEVERIKKAPAGTVAHCDNCGCILVP